MHMKPAQQPPLNTKRNEDGYCGSPSRTWPELLKKRRRYSPVRESAQQQQQQQQHEEQKPIQQKFTSHTAQSQQCADLQTVVTLPVKPSSMPLQPVIHSSLSVKPPLAISPARPLSSVSLAPANAFSTKVPFVGELISGESNGAGRINIRHADLLASKSNYELISSGQHADIGLHFSNTIKTGVMVKRATHRAAEQARRDKMKAALIDLAEFLLHGDVSFGGGTTCFVVMQGKTNEDDDTGTETEERTASSGSNNPMLGEKKTVNKAKLIEMALEKMKAQEKEIESLRKALQDSRFGSVSNHTAVMDEEGTQQ